jgi:RND family efflux transporter MFP subunit
MAEDISRLKIDRGEQSVKASSRNTRRPLIIAVLIIVVTLLFFRFMLSRAVEIETATVTLQYPSSSITLLNASGYVVAQRKAALAAKATGRLEWLGVEEGSRVNKGEIIARLEGLDADALQKQAAAGVTAAGALREQAEVEFLDAQRNLKRVKELLVQGVVSQADFDAAEARERRSKAGLAAAAANLAVSRAALDSADVSVDYTRIRAPFDGVVLTKNADVGDIVTPLGAAANAKASVVTIADLDSLRVETDVSESSLEKVRKGQACEILLDALPQDRFKGVVHSIVPTADRSKATVMVKVSFLERDRRVLPEMSAKVAFLERPVRGDEQQPRVMLPKAALVTRDGKSFVYLFNGDSVTEMPVETVAGEGELIEVKGVKAGDKVALKPLDKLSSGAKVKTVQK